MKDNEGIQIGLGIVVPICIVGLVAFNLVSWSVYMPLGRDPESIGPWGFATDSLSVVFVVALKLAAALAFYSWAWMANRRSTEHLAVLGMISAATLAGIGFAILIIGMFLG